MKLLFRVWVAIAVFAWMTGATPIKQHRPLANSGGGPTVLLARTAAAGSFSVISSTYSTSRPLAAF